MKPQSVRLNESNPWSNKTRQLLVSVSIIVALGMAFFPGLPLYGQTGKKVLIHMQSNIKKDDGPPCVAFNMALAALRAGYRVEILFDVEASYNIKVFAGDGKTDYQRYEVPNDLRQLIRDQYPDFPLKRIRTYQDFLAVYHEMGATITMNGTWNALTQIERTIKGKENIIKIAEPLTLDEMMAHIAAADIYLAY